MQVTITKIVLGSQLDIENVRLYVNYTTSEDDAVRSDDGIYNIPQNVYRPGSINQDDDNESDLWLSLQEAVEKR